MFEEEIDNLAFLLARSGKVVVQDLVVKTSWKSFFMDGFRLSKEALSHVPVPTLLSERTTLEKTLIAGGLFYGLCQANRFGLVDKFNTVTDFLVPGYSSLMSFFGKRLRVEVDPATCTNWNSLESRRDGSDERHMTTPSFQCKIGYKKDGKFVVIGCAIRFEAGCLVGPDHVLSDEDLDEKFALGKQGLLSLKGKERITLATDMVMIRMTEKDFSTIGISVCKIVSVPERGALAQIIGPESNGTCGRLICDEMNFGRVIYEGTTLAGYSGGGYCIGNGCAGVHQLGGKINSGLDASYIWMLVRIELGLVFEDSEEWLLGQFKAGKKLRWNSHGDPNFVQVHVGGVYSTVQKRSMIRAFGNNWDSSDYLYRVAPGYDDSAAQESVPVQGEASNSILLGVSSLSANSQEPQEPRIQRIMREYKALSSKQRKSIRKSLQIYDLQQPNISGQENLAQ